MARRSFTVAQVNGFIPEMQQVFVHVMQLRAGLRALETKLKRAGIEVSPEVVASDTGPRAVRQAKSFFRAYYELLATELGKIEALGGEVKDLDIGLVDFPGRRHGEEVCLCWKFGETRCGYWHATDTGYSNRRPVDELDLETTGAPSGRQ